MKKIQAVEIVKSGAPHDLHMANPAAAARNYPSFVEAFEAGANATVEALATAGAFTDGAESSWLVERTGPRGPLCLLRNEGFFDWGPHSRALRFVRREDAESMIWAGDAEAEEFGLGAARVTEHEWIAPDKPSRPVANGASELTREEWEALDGAVCDYTGADYEASSRALRKLRTKDSAPPVLAENVADAMYAQGLADGRAFERAARHVATCSKARAEEILNAALRDRRYAERFRANPTIETIEALSRAGFFADESVIAEIEKHASRILDGWAREEGEDCAEHEAAALGLATACRDAGLVKPVSKRHIEKSGGRVMTKENVWVLVGKVTGPVSAYSSREDAEGRRDEFNADPFIEPGNPDKDAPYVVVQLGVQCDECRPDHFKQGVFMEGTPCAQHGDEAGPSLACTKDRAEKIVLSAPVPDEVGGYVSAWSDGTQAAIEALDRAHFFADEATLAEIDEVAQYILNAAARPDGETPLWLDTALGRKAVRLATAVRKLGIGGGK